MMINSSDDRPAEFKSLQINHARNSQLYSIYLKHNTYLPVLWNSLKENLPFEAHSAADLSLSKTNLHVTLPYPISTPYEWQISEDSCLQLVKMKQIFKKKLESCKTLYKKDKNIIPRKLIESAADQDVIELPNYLINLTVHNTHKFFHGDYDWFYTGGILTKIDLNSTCYLVTARDSDLVFINLASGEVHEKSIKFPSPIYSIKGCKINNFPYILQRSKNNVQLSRVRISSSDKTHLKAVYQCKLPDEIVAPYIDTVILDEHKFITANVAYELKIHNIGSGGVVNQCNFDLPNGLNGDLCQLCVINHGVLFMSRSSITLLDFRNAGGEKVKSKTLREGFFHCNDLCTLCVSALNDNFVYVASKHNVYKVDLREFGVAKKWAHFLSNSPITIKAMRDDEHEYVFVSSFCETVCIHVSHHNHMPFKVERIQDTYKAMQLYDQFILREDLEKRFQLSTAGVEVDGLDLYTANSNADVFRSTIARHVSPEDKTRVQSILKLKRFVEQVPHRPKRMEVSHMKNLAVLKHTIFRHNSCEEDLKEYQAPNPRISKYLTPSTKFGEYDMARIWNSERGVMDMSMNADQQNSRISDWVEQASAVQVNNSYNG